MDLSNLSVEDKITRAKIQMYKQSPFYSYILLHMNIKEDTTGMVPTMAVDPNGNMFFNRAWVSKLTHEELVGLLAHETLHIALAHLERGDGRNRQLFNIANDLCVNDILISDSMRLPGDGLIPERDHSFFIMGYKVENINEKSSEQIYDELYPLAPKVQIALGGMPQDGDGQDSNGNGGDNKSIQGFDEHRYGSKTDNSDDGKDGDGKGNSNSINITREQKWRKIIAEAAQVAKGQGKLPAGLERMVEGILDSKVSWKHKLYKYIVDQIINDFSWSLPSKRTASLGIYLPRPTRESVHIVVSLDTSGSISKDDLRDFLSELMAISDSFNSVKMDIVICDCEVHETYELTKESMDMLLELNMSGGGGTSHIPIYDYVKENINDCKVLINFTDGYTSFPDDGQELWFDNMWVICKNGTATKNIPFGEVIRLSEDD